MKPPQTLPVYILAGGRSRRFGTDKARALIGGEPLIQRVADAIEPVASSLTVVAETVGTYGDLGFTTIADARPGMGPMAGLEAALSDRVARFGEGWLLLSACDLAEPEAALAEGLLKHISEDAQVVAYRGERWEPLFALYHSSIRSVVGQQLDAGQQALWRMIERVRHRAVSLPEGVSGITQLNTPDDLKRFQASVE